MSKGLIPLYDIPVNTPCYCQVLGYDVVIVNNRMHVPGMACPMSAYIHSIFLQLAAMTES